MDPLVHVVHPKHQRTIRPGRVGQLGETIVIPRFRQSTPTMPWAYDPYYAGKRAEKLGSNVQDGDTVGFDNKGGPARTLYKAFAGNRSFKHQYGRTIHDLVQPDKRYSAWVSSLGDFTWRNKLAMVRKIKTGDKFFSILPGPYAPEPNDLARGGSTPRTTIIDVEGEESGVPQDIVTGVNEGQGSYPLPHIGGGVGKEQGGTPYQGPSANGAQTAGGPNVVRRMR